MILYYQHVRKTKTLEIKRREKDMLLEKLVKDSIVNLEIVTEDEKYEIVSKVTGVSKNSLLIEDLKETKGQKAENGKTPENAIYNLYANDSDGNRIGWYNVSVRPIDYGNRKYKGIFTRTFNRESSLTDRRINERIKPADLTGRVETKDGISHEVFLYDLSNDGLSFIGDDGDYLNKKLTIHIEDIINGEIYSLNINCRCVREKNEEGSMLFGCSIGETEKSYMEYLFEKKLSLRRAEPCVV